MKRVGNYTHPFMSDLASKKLARSYLPNTVLIVIIVSFVPMLLVSGLILDQFSMSHNEKVYNHLKELVHKHTIDIDTFLNERLKNIRFLVDNCGMQALSDDHVLLQKLQFLQQTYGDVFEDLGVVNMNGVQESYAGRLNLKDANYSSSKWFGEAVNKKEYISDVYQGLRSRPHFIVSVKTICQGREVLLKATLNFETFNSFAENLRVGDTGFAYILNKDGEFQTKPHYNMVPHKKSYLDFIQAGKKFEHDTYVGKITGGSRQGEMIYVAALLKNNDWILVFQQEKSEAYEDLIHAQITAVVVIFLGALAIVVMNLFLLRKVVKRFELAEQEKELMNRQVIETGKLASVGELAAGVAHEINNPVAIMVEEAGLIEDIIADENLEGLKNLDEIKQALHELHNQGLRCKDITHKLLSFASKTNPDIESIHVNDIIHDVVAVSNMMAYARISVNTHLDENLPDIYGSKTEIQQILLNLINNALYALEKVGGEVVISTRMEDNRVLVIVEDNGPGIPEANLDRIFDPFFTTKPVGKGSGLGLSICFGIIEKMGGEIDVHSVIDQGTRFEIRLPLENPLAGDAQALQASNKRTGDPEIQNRENLFNEAVSLLLVDDEESFVKILSSRLSRRNIEVTTALSGSEAIQALRKVDFDLAILDLKLKDMDGLEVLKIFKKMYPEMEVVILSGHESEQTAREGIQHGAFAYLAKPCKFEELINTLRRAIQSSR
jgi:two-component system NtrC family sensor kinase